MFVPAVAVLPLLALCFSPGDIELFKLRNSVAEDLGQDTTFYSWLGLKKNAAHADIVKAYRKLSKAIHPDRNPGIEATERFARLNRVYKILRSPVREQYNSYLRSGFPFYDEATDEWYYKRYRPSLFIVAILLVALFTAVEFVVRKVNSIRQNQRLQDLIDDANRVALENSRSPGVISSITEVRIGPNTLIVHPNGDVYFHGQKLIVDSTLDTTWRDTFIGQQITKFQSGSKEHTGSASTDFSGESRIEAKTAPDLDSKLSQKPETLKKGAAKRRPAASRGKAKVF